MPAHKPDKDRGAYGVWLLRGRERLGWTQKQVVGYLRDQGVMSGEHIDGYYRAVEAGPGKHFGAEIHDVLVRLYGKEPEPLPEPSPASDTADLVAAIRSQTAAIDRLAAALEQDRDAGPPWAEALAVILGASLRGSRNEGSDGPHGSGAPLRDLV